MNGAEKVESTGKIEIWTDEPRSDTKNALPTLGRRSIERVSVDIEILSHNLSCLIEPFQKMLENQKQSSSGYSIDEIELSLGVNSNGSVALIGKIEAGVQGGIKVKLKRDK